MSITQLPVPGPLLKFAILLRGATEARVVRAAFSEVSGLAVGRAPLEAPARAGAVRVRPPTGAGLSLVLRHGVAPRSSVGGWQALRAEQARAEGEITLLDEHGRRVMRWRVHRAWVAAWTGPTLEASGDDVAIESVELAHEGIDTDESPDG